MAHGGCLEILNQMSRDVMLYSEQNNCVNRQNTVLFVKSHFVLDRPKHFGAKIAPIFES